MTWAISLGAFLGTILLALALALLWSRRADVRAALKEHRREIRLAADIVFELSNAVEPFVPETVSTQNVSRHGARVLTKRHWQPNDRVLVRLPAAAGRSLARIAYCAPVAEQSFAAGLKFSVPIDEWGLDLQRSDHPFGK